MEEVKTEEFREKKCFVVILIMITNSNCGNMHIKLVSIN